MRVPMPQTANGRTSFRATQPSTPPSNVRTTGPQGTPGGTARKPGTAGKMPVAGVGVYLWILVFAELALTGALRRFFRKIHGG